MIFIFQLLCFWFISESEVYGSHSVVGKYIFTPNDCGITSRSEGYNDMCFEWHKDPIGRPSNRIYEGRYTAPNEVPWMATIYCMDKGDNFVLGPCGGSLIAKDPYWVITAKHCVPSFKKCSYGVYLGQNSFSGVNMIILARVEAIYNHPSNKSGDFVDLSLLKLQPKSTWSSHDEQPLKAICLPEKNLIIEKYEYGFIAGWGTYDKYDQNSKTKTNRYNNPVNVGHIKLFPFNFKPPKQLKDSSTNIDLGKAIIGEPINNQSLLCNGDFGGPLWQYYRGRAVLIGVMQNISQPTNGYPCLMRELNPKYVVFMDVSKVMDWIEMTLNSIKK